jgi:mannose-6-phosphate isomerase-like protein (cupin superfamily)
MSERKNNIPWWANKYPFPSDNKKPALIRRENELYNNYGRGNERMTVEIFISTDKILMSAWIVPPGQSFQPPDIHTGDEPYYILKGIASVCNPETGQVVEAKAGDVVFIPAGCWHVTYNFGEEDMYLCAIIEGQPWSPEAMKLVEQLKFHYSGYKCD